MKFAIFYQAQLPKPLDQDDWDVDDERRLFQDTLTEIEFADRLGFDYVFLAEHHFTSEYNHMTASDVMLGAIGARTRSIRIGSGIVQMMPANNHPVKVAENVATIDLISNGRYEFGVGTGGATEQDAFWPDLPGLVEARKVYDVLWEALGETLKMMKLNPYPGCSLEYVKLPLGNVVPKPVQRPHPPLWLAVTNERSLKLAAEHGMGALCLAQGGPEVVRERVDGYWKAITANLKPAGDTINPVVATFANCMVAKTDERARIHERDGAAFSNYAIRRAHDLTHGTTHMHREFAAGGVAFENVNMVNTPEYKEHVERLAKQGSLDVSPDAPGSIIGSPDTARRRFAQYEASGVDVIGLAQQVGLRRHEDIMESLEQIGTLLPEFKERHEAARPQRQSKMEALGFPVHTSV